MSSSKHKNILIAAARNREIEGCADYTLSVVGPESLLAIFLDYFNEFLRMEGPHKNPYISWANKHEMEIKISSFQNAPNNGAWIDQRVDIIDFVHDTLGEKLWADGWFTAIGRS